MADISKCNGDNCTLKDSCYRFTVPANPHRQSYAAFTQDPNTKECEYYWDDMANLYSEQCSPT